jgi:hypothetical protein
MLTDTKEEAIWFALTDNRRNGLRLNSRDLKLCITKAIKMFPDKTAAVIAKEIGCSRSYAYEIENQLSASGQLERPKKRTGVDGRKRTTTKKQPASGETDEPVASPTAQPENEDHKPATSSGPVSNDDAVPLPTVETPVTPSTAPVETSTDPQVNLPSGSEENEAQKTADVQSSDPITATTLSQYHIKFFGTVPEDDEKRLSFSEMIVRQILTGKFEKEQSRLDLISRIEALLQTFNPK